MLLSQVLVQTLNIWKQIMIEEYENRSSELRSLLDVVHDRFRLRWRKRWSVDLWETLKQLTEAGKEQQGLDLLPNRAPNLTLVSYTAFNPLLLQDNAGSPDLVQMSRRSLSLKYAWDIGGNVVHLIVITDNEILLEVVVGDAELLETLLLDDKGLKGQLEESMKILLP
jgi:hypothetical protein